MKGNIRLNLLLLFGSLSLCFGVAEILLRSIFSEVNFWDRFLMFSSPLYHLEEDGAVSYLPNQTIREIAVYHGELEYDITFKTNNLGLIDHEDYTTTGSIHKTDEADLKSYLFVGDSFTAGAGGGPWVPELRDTLQQEGHDLQIYNLGLNGASIEHFQLNIRHFLPKLQADEIVLLAISDDFHRLYWWPLVDEREIRMCPKGEQRDICAKRRAFSIVVPYEITPATILLRADELKLQLLGLAELKEESSQGGITGLLSSSRFASLALRYYNQEPLFILAENKQQIGDSLKHYIRSQNFKLLEGFKEEFQRPIHFIHLPEKEEVVKGEYQIAIAEKVRQLGMSYFPALKRCSWSREMYHKHDTHPNRDGYKNLSSCVKRYLLNNGGAGS